MPEHIPGRKIESGGSEGMQLLAIEPERLLTFTWNAPPQLQTVHGQRTAVLKRLQEYLGKSTSTYNFVIVRASIRTSINAVHTRIIPSNIRPTSSEKLPQVTTSRR